MSTALLFFIPPLMYMCSIWWQRDVWHHPSLCSIIILKHSYDDNDDGDDEMMMMMKWWWNDGDGDDEEMLHFIFHLLANSE